MNISFMNSSISKYLKQQSKAYWCVIYYQITTNINQDYCSLVLELANGVNERYDDIISLENSGCYSVLLRVPSGCKGLSFDCCATETVSITTIGYKQISLPRLIVQFFKRSAISIYKEGFDVYISRCIRVLFSKSNQKINRFISLTRKNKSLTNYSEWLMLHPNISSSQSMNSISELTISESSQSYNFIDLGPSSEWVLLRCAKCVLTEQYQEFIGHELSDVSPSTQLIYFDHDYLVSEGRTNPQFNGDWDCLLFEQYNYLGPILLIKYPLVQSLLKYLATKSLNTRKVVVELVRSIDMEEQIYHVPIVAYSIISSEHTFSPYFLADVVTPISTVPPVSFLTECDVNFVHDNVTIIIPSRDNVKLLAQAINSILNLTTYPNYRILVVDNQSVHEETLKYLNSIRNDKKVHVISYLHEFNYSAINNFAAEYIEQNMPSHYMLLLNDDTEVISPDWLTQMLACFSRDRVGVVGSKLYYPNGTIQHAGVTIGVSGVAGHTFKYFPRNSLGPMSRLTYVRQVSAVTGACLLTTSALYRRLGGLDDRNLKVAFNDIDYCLKARQVGYKVVWTPYAELYHHESVSRGLDTEGKNLQRFKKEVRFMKNKWQTQSFQDPFYNRNFALNTEDCRLVPPGFR